MSEIISRDDLRGYVESLVRNLKNIRNPDEFHSVMRFRDGPRMVIDIGEDGKVIFARFNYLGHYNLQFPLFPKGKISEITDEDIGKFLGNEAVAVNAITNMVYNLFNRFKNK